jgi:hypothetical protein
VTGFPVDALLDELADRVADRLAATDRPTVEPEPWRLLNVREAAERLGRSERWVRARVKSGDLATVRLDGGALAFDVDDLRAFAAERRVGGRALAWRD